VEKEDEISSPLKPGTDNDEREVGDSHTAAGKLDLDGGGNHPDRKRKPSASVGELGGLTPDLNTPLMESSALVPAGLVTARRDQFGGVVSGRDGSEGLKKQKRSTTNARSAAAAEAQPRRAQ